MNYKAKLTKAKQEEIDAIKHCVRRGKIPSPKVEDLKTTYNRKKSKREWKKITKGY